MQTAVIEDLPAAEDEAVFAEEFHCPRQDLRLDLFPAGDDLLHRVARFVDPKGVLADDGALVEIGRHKVRRHPRDLHPLIIGL